jgi:DNA-binding NarL/FixJ family response regulator
MSRRNTMRRKGDRAQPVKRAVLIVDDHPLVRDALARSINQEPDLAVRGEAADADGALAEVEKLQPDVVIVDLSLQNSSGFELLKSISARYPLVPALVLSMHNERTHAVRALRAGARGYIMKNESVDRILCALRRVLQGRIWLREDIMPEVLAEVLGEGESAQDVIGALSQRELEVFELIGKGRTPDQIAKQLFISRRTVESHRDHIKTKLKLASVQQLHQLAFQWVRDTLAP